MRFTLNLTLARLQVTEYYFYFCAFERYRPAAAGLGSADHWITHILISYVLIYFDLGFYPSFFSHPAKIHFKCQPFNWWMTEVPMNTMDRGSTYLVKHSVDEIGL